MERDFEKDMIELDAAINSNAARDNTFTLSVLQRAKVIMLQQNEMLKAYENIGLYPEEVKEALKRIESKKPKADKRKYHEDYTCPYCGHRFISKDETGWFSGMRQKFCPDCGQAIDWESQHFWDNRERSRDGNKYF